MARKLLVVLLACFCLLAALDAKKPKRNRTPKRKVKDIVKDMEKNMTTLWQKVDYLSQPVHIHIHGEGDVEGHQDHHEDDHDHEDEMDDHYAHCHGVKHDHQGMSEAERTAHYAHCHGVAHDHDQAHALDREEHDHRGHGHEEGKDYDGHTHDREGHSHKDHKHDHKGHGHQGRPGKKDHGHEHKDHDHGHMGHEHEHKKKGGHDGHGHEHKDHDHGHVGHEHEHKKTGGHDGHGHEHHKKEDKKPMRQGPDHGGHHDNDEDDDDEKHGTHVHIHLHTALEKMAALMEKRLGMDDKHMDHAVEEGYRYATCDVVANPILDSWDRQDIQGVIHLRQKRTGKLEMKIDLKGFEIDRSLDERKRFLRGFHGHSYGGMRYGCASMGGHYNPSGIDHGAPGEHHGQRHPGDFGNMKVAEDGSVDMTLVDDHASLFGDNSFMGRGIVIHEAHDDLGRGGNEGSKKTGNAGGRIACCVIIASAEPENVWSP